MSQEPPKRDQLEEAANRAIDKQPDEIHMIAAPDHAWTNQAAVNAYAQSLSALGFSDAGAFTIDVLPAATRFLLKKPDDVYAVIYEHPKAGVWLNLVILYENGGSMTLTTTPDRGLEKRPGHPTLHAPGATADELYAMTQKLLNEPKRKALMPSSIIGEFERAWADGVKWRKSRGMSATEAISILLSRDGKNVRALRPDRIEFVAEQSGDPERELKKRLAAFFATQAVAAAYLVRVHYDESPEYPVALCLRGASAKDAALVLGIQKVFAGVFRAGVHLDTIFVVPSDLPRLERVSKPFYERV